MLRRFLMAAALLALAGCDENRALETTETDSPLVVETAPAAAESDPRVAAYADMLDVLDERARRVFYQNGGTREWGTLCRIAEDEYFSVDHVTVNGAPVVGPQTAVTLALKATDFSFLGVDPETLNADDYPELVPGAEVWIPGFPASDRDGELRPGRVYGNDSAPPGVWVELLPFADGSIPEGVVGGFSGSCVIDKDRNPVAVVIANGFSPIAGTTNTWALVIPIRAAILEAQGKAEWAAAESLIPNVALPSIETGRYGLLAQ